jgi:hypothetical protein
VDSDNHTPINKSLLQYQMLAHSLGTHANGHRCGYEYVSPLLYRKKGCSSIHRILPKVGISPA